LPLKPKSRSPRPSALTGLLGLSEKQYQAPTSLARNCRFFLLSIPVRDRALRASGTPSIDRVRCSLLKSLREKLDQFAGAHSFKELTTLSFRLASPVPSGRDPRALGRPRKHQGFETALGAPSGGSDRPKCEVHAPSTEIAAPSFNFRTANSRAMTTVSCTQLRQLSPSNGARQASISSSRLAQPRIFL